MKTDLTKEIEKKIFYRFNDKYGRGITAVFECPIGKDYHNEFGIVDAISFNQTKDEFTCFEIKVSVADFHSKSKTTFVGNRNYYAMPLEIYEKVKKEIPAGIGCYVLKTTDIRGYYYFNCVKKCKPKTLEINKEILLMNMLRSARNKTNLSFYMKDTKNE